MTGQATQTAAVDPAVVEALKPRAAAWFESLRDRICAAFEQVEDEAAGPFPPETDKPGRKARLFFCAACARGGMRGIS